MDVDTKVTTETHQPMERPQATVVAQTRQHCEQIAKREFPDGASTFTEVRLWDDRDFSVTVIHTKHSSPDGDGRWVEVRYQRSDGIVTYRDYEKNDGRQTTYERRTVETYGPTYTERFADDDDDN
jgi:hypothetical protein